MKGWYCMNIPYYSPGFLILSLEGEVTEALNQAAEVSAPAETPPAGSAYVAFDMEYLRDMADVIWDNIGTIVNVAIWIFLIILGVFTAITIIKNLAR